MAKPGPVMEWTQYLAARTAAMALTSIDVDWNLRTAGVVGSIVHRLDKRHHRRAVANISRCFPHWSAKRVDATAEASMQHLIRFVVETLHTPRLIHENNWAARLETSQLGKAIRAMNSDRPVILVTGHLGNFEILGYAMSTMGHRLKALARPLDNKLVYDWLLGIRERKGMGVITKWDATDEMIGCLQRREALAFVADQNAGPKGMFVPFMNRLASAYKSVALLAKRYDATVVCGYAHRRGTRFDYEVGSTDVFGPEDWANERDPLFYITARYTRAIEIAVRRKPEQYWWMHRRWKSRPRHEVSDKPMSRVLRRNLESLPWMTDELMRQVEMPIEPVK
ncbi:MAG: lysophospholipid acyltransferase family protein [Phycisphaeraceae bacterium]